MTKKRREKKKEVMSPELVRMPQLPYSLDNCCTFFSLLCKRKKKTTNMVGRKRKRSTGKDLCLCIVLVYPAYTFPLMMGKLT